MQHIKIRAQTLQVYHHIWQFFPPYCRMASIHKCTMVPQQQKAECVLSFHESKSVTTVENWFLTKFGRKPLMKESNTCQYDKSVTKGSIFQGKNSSYPPASEQTVDSISSLKSKGVNQKNLEFHQALIGHLSVRV